MTWQTPKTSWVATDYYGPGDLNRVESNTVFLALYLLGIGYPPSMEPSVTDRGNARIEFADELSRVERNVQALANGFIAPPGYEATKHWQPGQPFDYTDARRLEKNLQLLYAWTTGVVASFRRCGTFACGEEGEIY